MLKLSFWARRGPAAISFALVVAVAGIAGAQAKDSVATKVVTPQLDFSGVLYVNYQYSTDSATRARNAGNPRGQFNAERVYFTFRMPVGDDASVRITTDIMQGDQSATSYYKGWVLRLKYGYVQYNFLHDIGRQKGFNAVARVGMLHTVAIDHIEQFWPRWISQTAVERAGFYSSADVGAALLVTLPGSAGELYGTVTSGPAYTSGETDRFKDVALRLSLTPFARTSGWFKTFTVTPWVYSGETASAFQNGGTGQVGVVADGLRRDRSGLFVGVRDKRLAFGFDWAERTETYESGANTLASPRVAADTTGRLVSWWVNVRPFDLGRAVSKSTVGAVFRLDTFTPKVASVAGLNGAAPVNRLVVAGVYWEPTPRTSIALDYQAQTYSDYAPAAQPAMTKALFLHVQAAF